jgi:hypothetical protein
VKDAKDLKDVATIDSMLNDSTGYMTRLINYLPIVGKMLGESLNE